MRTEPSFSSAPDTHMDSQGNSDTTISSGSALESALLSDYRQHYGLSVDPFDDDPHFPFYTGAQRRQILEQLLHFCQFSNHLIVVAGEYGVGKTRMAQALIDALDDADDIGFIEGQITSDVSSLITDIYTQFDVSSTDEFLEFCQKKSEQDGLVVLIIDNAHHLTDEVISELLGLVQENLNSRLHLVLFSEPYLLNRLENINAPDIVLTDLILEKFSLTESVDYLNFRMEMADYLGPELFVEAKVDSWWHKSQGQLLLLHEQAQEKLLASVSAPRSTRNYDMSRRNFPVLHVVGVSALVGVLILGYVYWGAGSTKKSPVITSVPIQTESIAASVAASQSSISTPISSSALDVSQNAVLPRAVTPSSASQVATTMEKSQAERTVKQSVVPLVQAHEIHNPSTQGENKFTDISSSVDAKKMDRTSAAMKVESAKLSKDTSNIAPKSKVTPAFSEQEKIILSWNSSDFTLQLMGLSNEKAAHDFIAAQPNKKDLLLFKSIRQGKDWFVVVTGHYKSSAQARQAIQDLPEAQKKASPWPRELEVIHKEIRQ